MAMQMKARATTGSTRTRQDHPPTARPVVVGAGPGRALGLQRAAGNRAVARLHAHRPTDVQRAPRGEKGKIMPPGQGYDNMQGDPLTRDLNSKQVEVVKEFRTRLEATREQRGSWARDASTITANFAGSPFERAVLYGELQRQMMQVESKWTAVHLVGRDGSHIFVARLAEKVFVVGADGRCWFGPVSTLKSSLGETSVNYRGLTEVTGSPALSSVSSPTPKARTTSGEIAGPKGSGGRGTGGTVTAGRGGAPTPITTPEPARQMSSKQGTLAAGALALLQMQLGNIRAAERAKATKKLEELAPRIDQYRNKGFSVTVTLVVEVPNQVDIAAVWAGIGDITQVVYFREMYIVYAGPLRKEEPKQKTPVGNLPEPDQLRQNEAVDEPRRPAWYTQHPKKGFHFASSELHLLPHQGASTGASRGSQPVFVFKPDRILQQAHFGHSAPTDTNRSLNISTSGVQMWNATSRQEYVRTDKAEGRAKRWPTQAEFTHDVGEDRHAISSYFSWKEGGFEEYAEYRQLGGPARAQGKVSWKLDQVLWRSPTT